MDISSSIVVTAGGILLNMSAEELYFTAVVTLVTSLVTLAWYYLFWMPFDWCQDLTELGFDHARTSHKNYSEATKRNVINEYQKRRKIGDLPPVYPNGWFVVLESDDLKERGVQEVSALGMNLVAWRGTSGKAYIADAYCPHLGAHLGVGGTVDGECITCPFHSWSFTGETGSLTNIPYGDCENPEIAKIKLHKILEQNGYIYLWFHAEDEEPSWYPPVVPEIESGQWAYRGRSEFRIACHAQDIPENAADINHLNVVHKPHMLAGSKPANSWFQWGSMKHVWSSQWKACEEKGMKHVAILNLTHHLQISNYILSVLSIKIRAVQMGPGIVYLEFDTPVGRGILFHMVTPLEPLLQRLNHRFYTSKTFIHPWAKFFLFGEAVMIARDSCIWNRKSFTKNPILPKQDSGIKRFRKWYQQFYSENSPRKYFTRSESDKNLTDF